MEYFCYESCGLTKVEGDSIIRFATKVDTYVTYYPETKSDPYYPEIVDNIKEAAKLCGLIVNKRISPHFMKNKTRMVFPYVILLLKIWWFSLYLLSLQRI